MIDFYIDSKRKKSIEIHKLLVFVGFGVAA